MSLSPFDSFQSRFVTYLLNRPRINIHVQLVGLNETLPVFTLLAVRKTPGLTVADVSICGAPLGRPCD